MTAAVSEREPIAAIVKRETALVHRRAEDAVARFDPFRSRVQYARYLEALYGLYVDLEPRLSEALRGTFDYEPRCKQGLIAADLRCVRAPVDPERPLPRCAQLPRLDDAAQAMGVAYVVERVSACARALRVVAWKRAGSASERSTWRARDVRQLHSVGRLASSIAAHRG